MAEVEAQWMANPDRYNDENWDRCGRSGLLCRKSRLVCGRISVAWMSMKPSGR